MCVSVCARARAYVRCACVPWFGAYGGGPRVIFTTYALLYQIHARFQGGRQENVADKMNKTNNALSDQACGAAMPGMIC